jgi:hypothetical protein
MLLDICVNLTLPIFDRHSETGHSLVFDESLASQELVGCLERIIACTVASINETIWDDSIEKALLVLICSNTTSIETLAENVFTRAKRPAPARDTSIPQ